MNSDDMKEKIRMNVKENIAISNIRKEFDMKNKNNKKVIYGILSACAMFILCVGIAINVNFQPDITNVGELSKDNTIIQEEKNIPEDNIVFNNGSIESMASIDANWKDANLKEELKFIDRIHVPEGLYLARQGKLYVRENIDSNDYSKLRQYTLIYLTENNANDSSQIEIIFTKEPTILGCMLPDEKRTKSSTINGKEVKLFKGQYMPDKSKIAGYAFFEKDGYKFYIDAHRIDEDAFINVLKSIL